MKSESEPQSSILSADTDTASETDRVSLASAEDYEGISHIDCGAIAHLIILIIGTAIFGYGWYYFTSSRRPVIQWLLYVFYVVTMIRGVLQFVQNRRMWDVRMRRGREERDGDMEMGLVEDEGRWFGDGDEHGGWRSERDGDGLV